MQAKIKKSTTKSKHHLHAAKHIEPTKPLSTLSTPVVTTTTDSTSLAAGIATGKHLKIGKIDITRPPTK